jgi:hypothetical protein
MFVLFINDLCTYLREQCGSGFYVNNNIPDSITLLHADDVASPADTVVNLQCQLYANKSFCDNVGID